MKRWFLIVGKEMREIVANYKILWLPLAFLLLAVQQPISTYYLPQLLEMAGGLPVGTVLEFPVPKPEEVMVQVISQLQMLGIAILVLAFMGSVSGEITNGSAGLILMRPVSLATYLVGKWSAAAMLMLLALSLAWVGSAYYTSALFGSLSVSVLLKSLLVYSVWLLFVLALLIFAGSVSRSAVGAAAMTIGVAVILSIGDSIFSSYMVWNPAKLSEHAALILLHGDWAEGLGLTLLSTCVLTIAMLALGARGLARREVLL